MRYEYECPICTSKLVLRRPLDERNTPVYCYGEFNPLTHSKWTMKRVLQPTPYVMR